MGSNHSFYLTVTENVAAVEGRNYLALEVESGDGDDRVALITGLWRGEPGVAAFWRAVAQRASTLADLADAYGYGGHEDGAA